LRWGKAEPIEPGSRDPTPCEPTDFDIHIARVEATRHEQATVGDRPSNRQAELVTKTREYALDILRVDQDSIDPTNQRLR
jgi:hypothetical protein